MMVWLGYVEVKALLRHSVGEGNGTPLQYSCLENPRDRGLGWAAGCGVAQSRTRLTRLSSSSSSKTFSIHQTLSFMGL